MAFFLAAILSGCGSGVDDSGPAPDSDTCEPEHVTTEVVLTAEEYADAAGTDGELSLDECEQVCADAPSNYDDCDGSAPAKDGGAVVTCGRDTECPTGT